MKSALRIFVSTMGAWMGVAGVEHGLGEIAQGRGAHGAQAAGFIRSWPDAPFFHSLGGEPAFTLVPDMRITGLLAVLFSLLYLAWAVFFVARPRGGWALLGLAVPMFLFGAGIFPPILGLLIGLAGTCIPARQADGSERMPAWWLWLFAASQAAWLALFPGVGLLSHFFGIDSPRLIVAIIALALGLLVITGIGALIKSPLAFRT